MKIAVVHNTPKGELIVRRGSTTHEWLNPEIVENIVASLTKAGYQAQAIEADIHMVEGLKDFFGSDLHAPLPGMVFDLAYGVQGKMRYCQLPGILEMLGLPYIGSDPLGHALATDKLTAKQLFTASGLPTPAWEVFQQPDTSESDLAYPIVVKPVAEAASEGLQLVESAEQLAKAVREDLEEFGPPILAESFIGGRELNVSLMGNGSDLKVLPPAELVIEGEEKLIYDADAKHGRGEKKVRIDCPASLPEGVSERACEMARKSFKALRCRDWARADMRLDDQGNLYLLEVNTIPAIGPRSSYYAAAKAAGMEDLTQLLRALVQVALKRNGAEDSSIEAVLDATA